MKKKNTKRTKKINKKKSKKWGATNPYVASFIHKTLAQARKGGTPKSTVPFFSHTLSLSLSPRLAVFTLI